MSQNVGLKHGACYDRIYSAKREQTKNRFGRGGFLHDGDCGESEFDHKLMDDFCI